MVDALGFGAATLTSIAFFPQVVKTLRTRQADDLSLLTLIVQNVGVALWIVYGVVLNSLPMMIGNSVTLALMLTLLMFKVRHGQAGGARRAG